VGIGAGGDGGDAGGKVGADAGGVGNVVVGGGVDVGPAQAPRSNSTTSGNNINQAMILFNIYCFPSL